MTTQAKPGRPEVGPVITLRVTPEDLAEVDHVAAKEGISRAEWLRRAARDRLWMPREELAPFIGWLVHEGVDGWDVAKVIERPYDYTDWHQAFLDGKSLDDLDE